MDKRKKVYSVFAGFLLIEIFIIVFAILLGDSCGSACDPHSLCNPFGIEKPTNDLQVCIMSCVWRPHPLFYVTFDVFVSTIILFTTVLIFGKKFISDKSGQEVQEKKS